MPDPDLSALTDLAFAAALDDALWRPWAQAMISGFGCQGGFFCVMNSRSGEMSRHHFLHPNVDADELAAEYLSGPVHIDPQVRRVRAARRSEIFVDTDHVDLDDPATREYLAWQGARTGTRHHMTATIALDERFEAGLSLHRSAEAGATPADMRRAFEAMFSDVACALRLGFRHAELVQQSWWEGLQSQSDKASILLDEGGRALRLSPAAERIVAAGDGLTIIGGRLAARAPADDERLQCAILGSVCSREARSGAATIRRASGRKPYRMLIYPMARKRRSLAPLEAAALVSIVDPAGRSAKLAPAHRELLGLTAREAEIADLLLAGHSLDSVAAVLGISPNTAKVHLHALFRKTETSRQSDLVRLLLTAP